CTGKRPASPHNDNRTAAESRCHQPRENALKLKLHILLVAAIGALVSPATASTAHSAPQRGIASVYSTHEGTRTASGIRLRNGALTAAHRSLPFGTKVKVTHRKTGRSVVVTITDRGPFVRGRVIDLTPAGARALGFSGLAPVTLDLVRS